MEPTYRQAQDTIPLDEGTTDSGLPAATDSVQESELKVSSPAFKTQHGNSVTESVDNISAEEQVQVAAALRFLGKVKQSLKSNPTSRTSVSLSGSIDGSSSGNNARLPELVGKYRIIRSIGRGGFAEVFLALDEILDRFVALKVPLFASDQDDQFRQRFEREARAAAILTHPQIVPVYEYGTIGPIAFITYAWIDGPDLATWLRNESGVLQGEENGKCNLRLAAEIVAALAQAIQHAHQRGLVHRDLKPSNILVDCQSEEKGLPLHQRLAITDFGLALQIADSLSLSVDGTTVGTPAYMSPEQADGQRKITHASDIWSLGVILFELLAGSTPFCRDTTQATLDAIREDELVPIRRLRAEVPRDLAAICEKCLNKLPSDRYLSAAALADDLHAWLEGRTIAARPTGRMLKLKRWVLRNPGLAASLSVTFLTLVVATLVTAWKWSEANRHLQLTQSEKFRVQQNLSAMSDIVNTFLDSWGTTDLPDELTDAQRDTVTRVLRIEEEILAQNRGHAGLKQSLIRSYIRVGDLRLALGEYDQVLLNNQQAYRVLPEAPMEFASPEDLTDWLRLHFLECNALLGLNEGEQALGKIDRIENRLQADQELLESHLKIYFLLKTDFTRGQARILMNEPRLALLEFQKVSKWIAQNDSDGLSIDIRKLAANSLISQSYTEHRLTRYPDSLVSIRHAIQLLNQLHAESADNFSIAQHLASAHYQAASTLSIIHVWPQVEENLLRATELLDHLLVDHGRRVTLIQSVLRAHTLLGRTRWHLGKHELAFAASDTVDQWFKPPFDQSVANQRVQVQNLVERSRWLRELQRQPESYNLAHTAYRLAQDCLPQHSKDLGAQQSLYSAQFGLFESLDLDREQDRADQLLEELRVQGERIHRLRPNRETMAWVWQCQEKAWKAKASCAAKSAEFDKAILAIQSITEIPHGPHLLDFRLVNAARHFVELLSENGWYYNMPVDQQQRAVDLVIDLLERSMEHSKLTQACLAEECWGLFKNHSAFIEIKEKLTSSSL